MKTYFCVGCRKVHHDNDFSEEDGDLEIHDWNKLLESVNYVGKRLEIEEVGE